MMRQILQVTLFLLGSWLVSCTTPKHSAHQKEKLLQIIDRNFQDASAQYKQMMSRLPADRFPKTYYAASGKFMTSTSGDWCSGFYPGTLLYLFEQTKDPALLQEAERILQVLEKEKYNRSMHDLGFMMYCSFGNAERIAARPEYKEILLTSARSLASRFNSTVGCIKSWANDSPARPARNPVLQLGPEALAVGEAGELVGVRHALEFLAAALGGEELANQVLEQDDHQAEDGDADVPVRMAT